MAAKKGKKTIKIQDLKPKKDAKGGYRGHLGQTGHAGPNMQTGHTGPNVQTGQLGQH